MRNALILGMLSFLLPAALAGAWVAMNYWAPGDPGTPVHAGAISNGRPQDCTNLVTNVRARSQAERVVTLEGGEIVRGTFEVHGGWGRVDIFLRVVSPQGLEILASPRAENYEFSFPAPIRGNYVFELDNRFSLYTSKAVALYYCIDRGEPLLTP
jgi:hypothetical protein